MKINACTLRQLALFALASMLTINTVGAAALSPTATYLKYRTALASATKIEELSSFLAKQVNDEIKQTPAEMKPMMFGLMKETTPQQVKVLSEDIQGDNANIALSSEAPAAIGQSSIAAEITKGSVTLTKEDGEWKIKKESWDSKIVAK